MSADAPQGPESEPVTVDCRWRQAAPWLSLAAIVAGYVVFAVSCFVPACPETDVAGYLLLARRLAAGQSLAVPESDPFLCHDHYFVENARGETVPKYAPGLPFLMAIVLKLGGGDRAVFALSPVFGALSLIGAFLLIRLWTTGLASVIGVLVLACDPLFLSYTNYPLAHATELGLVTLGMFLLWRWLARPQIGFGVAAGLLLGYAQLVRPASAVLVLVVIGAAAAVWLQQRTAPPAKQTLALVLAYAVFPVVHMLYNGAVFGGPFLTGYGLSGEQSAFSLLNLWRNLPFAASVLVERGPSLCLGVGVVSMLTERSRTQLLLKLLWFLPTVVVYGSYYWAPRVNPSGYGRFFLPVVPLLVGSAFALTARCCEVNWQRVAALIGLAAAVILLRGPSTVVVTRHVPRVAAAVAPAAMAANAVRQQVPPGSVIFAEAPALYQLSTELDYRVYDLSAFRPDHAVRKFQNRTDSKVCWQPARIARFLAFYRANSSQLGVLLQEKIDGFVAAAVPLYAVVPADELARCGAAVGSTFQLEPVTTWNPTGKLWGLYAINAAP